MNQKLFYTFLLLPIISFAIQATHFGFSLDYDGELSGSVSCGYDIKNIRLQSELRLGKDLEVQPNFTALAVHSSKDSANTKALTELEVGLINWQAHMALFTYSKYRERTHESQKREEEALQNYREQSKKTNDIIAQAQQEINKKRNNA